MGTRRLREVQVTQPLNEKAGIQIQILMLQIPRTFLQVGLEPRRSVKFLDTCWGSSRVYLAHFPSGGRKGFIPGVWKGKVGESFSKEVSMSLRDE